ncbi:MAG: hypothetical protein ABFD89_09950 [Bryobacteraceae bacterium]
MGRSKSPVDGAARLLKQAQALRLRALGYKYRAIASQLSIGLATAKRLVDDAFVAERESISQAKADLVELEVLRCDTYLQAIAKKIQAGDIRAVDTALKVGKRRAELLGLDAPQRVEASGPNGGAIPVSQGPDLTKLDDAELLQLAALTKKAQAAE